MLRLSILAIVAAGFIGADRPSVVLTGTAKDCAGRKYVQIPGVTIAAFDPATNRKLVDLLKAMDTAVFVDADLAAMARFTSKYEQLKNLMVTSAALARISSDAGGSFGITVPAIDSILVVGYQDVEDQPNYYSYKIVRAQANTTFVLDMSRGACHYPR